MPNDKKTIAEAKNNSRSVKRQLPNKQNTTVKELDRWAVENWPTVCIGQQKTTAEQAKKQLPNRQKTTAERSKHNCRTIKTQLPKSQKTTAERSKNNCRTSKTQLPKNNCRTIKKQLPKQQNTTAEPKNNCRNVKRQLPNLAVWQLKNNKLCASEMKNTKWKYSIILEQFGSFRERKEQIKEKINKNKIQNKIKLLKR